MKAVVMHHAPGIRRQRGLSLIELLVAMAIGLAVTLAAVSMLVLGSSGFSAVDATTAMRDKERFAVDLISRVAVQSGFEDWGNAAIPLREVEKARNPAIDPEPDVFGWNNAVYSPPSSRALSTIADITNGNRPGLCGTVTGTSCRNGSDILVLRYQGMSKPTDPTEADNSIIDCAGVGVPASTSGSLDDRAISIFHLTVPTSATAEASLSCASYSTKTGAWIPSRPLIEGVESFQVLYGTDGVTPGVATASGSQDTVAERWLRADEINVPGSPVATRENWRRVRSIRIGLTLRGTAGSAQEAKTATVQPMGPLFASAADVGSELTVAADRRLRQTSTFTIHLRNAIKDKAP